MLLDVSGVVGGRRTAVDPGDRDNGTVASLQTPRPHRFADLSSKGVAERRKSPRANNILQASRRTK